MVESKGVDTDGFIRAISGRLIQPAFQTAVDNLCEMLLDCLGPLIDSVYLYGSVARGDAKAGKSDLDVTLILIREPIRSTNVLRSVEALSWPESLEDHVDHFLVTYPEMRPQITYFLFGEQMLGGDQDDFVERLRIFSAWMQLQI